MKWRGGVGEEVGIRSGQEAPEDRLWGEWD